MECDRDTSGKIRWRKCTFKVVRIDPFGADRLGAVTESNEQVVTFTKATPHEEDLLTARDRSMVWADLLKGAWRREGLSGRMCGLGNWLVRSRGQR